MGSILGNDYINALWGFKVSGFMGDSRFGGLGFRVVFGFRALGFRGLGLQDFGGLGFTGLGFCGFEF